MDKQMKDLYKAYLSHRPDVEYTDIPPEAVLRPKKKRKKNKSS